jgi:hypothetical protein
MNSRLMQAMAAVRNRCELSSTSFGYDLRNALQPSKSVRIFYIHEAVDFANMLESLKGRFWHGFCFMFSGSYQWGLKQKLKTRHAAIRPHVADRGAPAPACTLRALIGARPESSCRRRASTAATAIRIAMPGTTGQRPAFVVSAYTILSDIFPAHIAAPCASTPALRLCSRPRSDLAC